MRDNVRLGFLVSYGGVGGGAPCICVRCIKKCASQLNLFGDPSAQRLTLNAVAVFWVFRIPGQVWESFKDSRNGKANTSLEKAQSLEAGMFSFMCFSKKSSPSPAPSLSIITNFWIGALQLFLSDSQGNAEKLQSGDIKRNMTMMLMQVNLIILSLFNTSNH